VTRAAHPVARLGIDARLGAYRAGGIAEHTARLLEGLAALRPPERVVVIAHRRARFGPAWRRPWARPRPAGPAPPWPGVARYVWTPPHHRCEGRLLPVELARLRLDLLHCPDVVLPAGWHGAGVATVHDLAFLRRPELLTRASRRYYRGVYGSVRRAARVIVVSEHTRRELLALTDTDPARVVVIPNAVHGRYLAPGDAAADAAVAARYGLAGDYLLFVSTIEPRKNVGVLLTAYRQLLDRGHDLPLALAGGAGWLSATVYAQAEALGLAGRARFLGYVPTADLPALYRRATVLAHPALDEGFGLTPLEAMAAGTAVVVSDAGSLPEVVGEAGLRVPATDPAAWATALAALLADPARRQELAARGRARAAGYTVARLAEATLATYRAALADHARRRAA
jgi:glycosyltransferase involved in cell wall biosynthesis